MKHMASSRSAALATTLVLSACAGTGVIRVERTSLPPAIAEAIRRASDHRDAGEHDASLQVVQLLLERDPWLVPAHRIRQDLERERGREGSLIVEYLELVRAHPDRPEPCYLMGRLERNLDLQEQWFQRAVEAAPGDYWGQFGLAFVARRRGRLDEAETRYRALVDARPEEPLAHTSLGEVLRMLRKYPDAERAYRHFQQHFPSDGRADLGLARTFWEGGRRELVLGALVRAVQRRPGDPAVVDLVGQFLETAAAPPERRRIRDLIESHTVRDPFVRAGGGPLLGSLALEEGDLAGLRRYLETDTKPPASPELFLLWRRARVAEGAVGHAVSEWEKRLPRSLISDPDNRIRGRLIGLLRGPWRKATTRSRLPMLRWTCSARCGTPDGSVEAKVLAEPALLRHAGHAQIDAIADEIGRQLCLRIRDAEDPVRGLPGGTRRARPGRDARGAARREPRHAGLRCGGAAAPPAVHADRCGGGSGGTGPARPPGALQPLPDPRPAGRPGAGRSHADAALGQAGSCGPGPARGARELRGGGRGALRALAVRRHRRRPRRCGVLQPLLRGPRRRPPLGLGDRGPSRAARTIPCRSAGRRDPARGAALARPARARAREAGPGLAASRREPARGRPRHDPLARAGPPRGRVPLPPGVRQPVPGAGPALLARVLRRLDRGGDGDARGDGGAGQVVGPTARPRSRRGLPGRGRRLGTARHGLPPPGRPDRPAPRRDPPSGIDATRNLVAQWHLLAEAHARSLGRILLAE